MKKINAILLAGDGKKSFIQEGVENKALFLINGKPMVEYVVDALLDSSLVDRIAIVGPVEHLKQYLGNKVDYYMEGRESIFDNIKLSMLPFIGDEAVLVVTSDIPMIKGQMVTDFVQRAWEQGADFCYPIVDKRLNEEFFPNVERTYVRLKEGTFTGGNIAYMNPAVLDTCEEFGRKLILFRKTPWKTAKLLGFKFLIGLLLGNLTLSEVEQRFCNLLNIKAAALIVDYPEIGNDVDKPADVEMVMEYFGLSHNLS